MKLLFDENLSPKLPREVAALFPGSVHVRECGLKGFPDSAIWTQARTHGFIVVSKDSDFFQRSVLYGSPPKVIWLRIGNCTRGELVTLLTERAGDNQRFDSASEESVLVLG